MKEKTRENIQRFMAGSVAVRLGLLAAVLMVITILLYPNMLMTPQRYEVGDIAEADIKAPGDFYIQDREATEDKRRDAMERVLTVYDNNEDLLPALVEQVSGAFGRMREGLVAEMAGASAAGGAGSAEVPGGQGAAVPAVPAAAGAAGSAGNAAAGGKAADVVGAAAGAGAEAVVSRDRFVKLLGLDVSEEQFDLLKRDGFPREVGEVIAQILTQVLDNGVVANKDVLLSEKDRGIVLRGVGGKTETVVRNLRKYYGPDQYKEMVRIVAEPLVKSLHPNMVPVVVDIAQRLIQPNITLNRSETEKRKREAAEQVKPLPYQIKEGEMLLREGERVTEEKLVKLATLNEHREQERLYQRSIGSVAVILCLLLIKYYLHMFPRRGSDDNHNKDLLFVATILALFFFIPKVSAVMLDALARSSSMPIPPGAMAYGIPLAASAMTVCLFMGMRIAIPFALVMSVTTAIIFQNRFELFLYFILNCTMGAYWMQTCKERKVFIHAGVKLGALNILLATVLEAYMGQMAGVRLFWSWAFAFSAGITAGVLTAGLVPLMEMAFGYTTDITLLELGNLERPILRRLMLEAPGTYHHSVVVGSMVEAAAAEIDANPLLAKVCGYYHDIGKIKKPLYFVENQTDGKNRHDKLAPSMSSLILISHVKDGVEIARRNKLGGVIIDSIRQHHGTSLIRFFYEKARKMKGEENVNIDNFRYPGPKPQTREAGLVMLADVVEAASRTLENPTPSRIQGNVQKLINGIFTDGQLDNCELTLRDLHKIAKSFNKILNGIHHHRIEYTDAATTAAARGKAERKERNGRTDQQPAKFPRDTGGKPAEDGSGRLKRLGVS